MMSEKAVIAQKAPYATDVVAGERYRWCACGQSKRQPFCDGSHKGSGIRPVSFTAEKTETVYLCGCKQTKNQPMCDGTHKSL
ncbi:CDGSH iron-sulfur domain-containing protein [Neptunomonas qingdaonensis]|uniref:Iron-binding zinc finger CDGSH type n=1 Tax=Neptunomonas qingdaonensis TaxID=1045558 RepID=A0A1I2TK30_9GAMM|nr:CDGSH iron-sulfur domain-containing protein [Neptunomonas qingdaonensis]SFG65285.1 Iron-binding zinc finger CDGSH type [Neptunomonas qingdaonensis]